MRHRLVATAALLLAACATVRPIAHRAPVRARAVYVQPIARAPVVDGIPLPADDTGPTTPDADFRAHAPLPDARLDDHPPAVERFTLSNGLTVLLLPRHDRGLVHLRLGVPLDSDTAPSTDAGLGIVLAERFRDGPVRPAGSDWFADFERVAVERELRVEDDALWIETTSRSSDAGAALGYMAESFLHPQLDAERVCAGLASVMDTTSRREAQPSVLADNTLRAMLFGADSIRGAPTGGSSHALLALATPGRAGAACPAAARVRAMYTTRFVPTSAVLVAVGDTTREALSTALNASLQPWSSATVTRAPPRVVPAFPATPSCVLVDRPGLTQVVMRMGFHGPPPGTRAYDALQLAGIVLGSMGPGRLFHSVREQHGYAYDVQAGLLTLRRASVLVTVARLDASHAADALVLVRDEIARLAAEPPTDDEWLTARALLRASRDTALGTLQGVGGLLLNEFLLGLATDADAGLVARLAAVRRADVRDAARRWLDPRHAAIALVGDASVLAPQLRARGLSCEQRPAP